MKRLAGLTGLLCLLALGACSYTSKEDVVPAGASTTTVVPGGTVEQQTTTVHRTVVP